MRDPTHRRGPQNAIARVLEHSRDRAGLASVLPSTATDGRDPAAPGSTTRDVQQRQMQVIERGESPIGRPTRWLILRRGLMAVWSCVVLAATTAMAQQSVETVTETVIDGTGRLGARPEAAAVQTSCLTDRLNRSQLSVGAFL